MTVRQYIPMPSPNMPVLGTRNDNPDIVRKDEVDETIIAMPTVPGKGALSLWERANGLWQQLWQSLP